MPLTSCQVLNKNSILIRFLTSNRGGIVLNICKNCNYCIETGTTVKIVERKIIEVEK